MPLRDRTTKTRVPPPPDSYDEISGQFKKKLENCVHHVDGARANKKCHRRAVPLQAPLLLAVKQRKKQFSRFAKVSFKEIGSKLAAHLAKQKSSSKNSARFRVSTNRVEGLSGQVNAQIRRMLGGKLPSGFNRSAVWLAELLT